MSEREVSYDYRLEAARLRSFQNWPVTFLNAMDMVSAGFYYTGTGDKVRCFDCQIEIYNWVRGHDPMNNHHRWSSRCRFVKRIPCGNVPLNGNPVSIPSYQPRSRGVCGPYSSETSDCKSANPYRIEWCHPEFVTPYARHATFQSWPEDKLPLKLALIEAGFYYTGKDDKTICYYCGGGLYEWGVFDNPWEEHAKWLKKCGFVKLMKGQAFIDQQLAKEDLYTIKAEKQEKSVVKTENTKKVQPDLSDDDNLCKICFINEVGASFQPCGHVMSCYTCAVQIPNCAVCRQSVMNVVRVILS